MKLFTLVFFNNLKIDIKARTKSEAFFFFSKMYYDDMQAKINKKHVKIYLKKNKRKNLCLIWIADHS